jgi:hypothetical protein
MHQNQTEEVIFIVAIFETEIKAHNGRPSVRQPSERPFAIADEKLEQDDKPGFYFIAVFSWT